MHRHEHKSNYQTTFDTSYSKFHPDPVSSYGYETWGQPCNLTRRAPARIAGRAVGQPDDIGNIPSVWVITAKT
jgi:hypothetical protein